MKGTPPLPPHLLQRSFSGGEVGVLHGVKAVNRGEEGGVPQRQTVTVSQVTQGVWLRAQALETWKERNRCAVSRN